MATAVLGRMYSKNNEWIPCQSDATKIRQEIKYNR